MNRLALLGDELERGETITEIWGGLLRGLAPYGIDFAIYLTVDAQWGEPFLLSNVEQIHDGIQLSQDPFVRHCCESYSISCTGPAYLPSHEYLTEEEREFIRHAGESGFLTGLGIPMRLTGSERFGGFNLGTRLDRVQFEAEILPMAEGLRFLCLLVHRRIEELTSQEAMHEDGTFRKFMIAPDSAAPGVLDQLSPREREVIFLVAQGLSRKECARLCAISQHTVAEYIKNAYRKLGIRNRVEAARIVSGLMGAPFASELVLRAKGLLDPKPPAQ